MAYTTILQLNYDSSVCDKTVTLLLAIDEYLAHGSLWQIVLTVGRHYGWQTVSDGSDQGCITSNSRQGSIAVKTADDKLLETL